VSDNNIITGFTGSYHTFLSNDFPLEFILNKPLLIDGLSYPTVEHALQAARTLDITVRHHILEIKSPLRAKLYGTHLKSLGLERSDWNDVRDQVMLNLLKRKFCPETRPYLAQKLHNTGNKILLNSDNILYIPLDNNDFKIKYDTYWGIHKGKGRNMLGHLLTKVRLYNSRNYEMR
jgi:ribA/ribD-fused uncharacterized protein